MKNRSKGQFNGNCVVCMHCAMVTFHAVADVTQQKKQENEQSSTPWMSGSQGTALEMKIDLENNINGSILSMFLWRFTMKLRFLMSLVTKWGERNKRMDNVHVLECERVGTKL